MEYCQRHAGRLIDYHGERYQRRARSRPGRGLQGRRGCRRVPIQPEGVERYVGRLVA